MDKDSRQTQIDVALKALNKKFGDGTIMRLDKNVVVPVAVNPTGLTGLDYITGVGGIPRGRITEIFGPEGVGKTTLCYEIIAEVQQNNGLALFMDAEHSCDPEYAKRLGADFDKLIFSQPSSGEEAFEIIGTMIQTQAIDIVVVDSAAALTPMTEVEDPDIAGQKPMGHQARMMSQALRNIGGILRKSQASLIFTNQLRAKIGPMGSSMTTPAGNALKFYAKMRLDIKKTESIGKQSAYYGHKVRVRTVKNNLARPYQEWEGQLIWGKGFDRCADLLWTARRFDVVTLSGPYYKFEDANLALGYDNAIELVKNNKELYDRIKGAIMAKLGSVAAQTEKLQDENVQNMDTK